MKPVKASLGCLLMLAGLGSGFLSLVGFSVFGLGIRNEWCLPGIFVSILGGFIMGYGIVRRGKKKAPPPAPRA